MKKLVTRKTSPHRRFLVEDWTKDSGWECFRVKHQGAYISGKTFATVEDAKKWIDEQLSAARPGDAQTKP